MRKIVHIIGARPNFMKAAPLISQLKKNRKFQQVIVHTGQHFDKKMSDVFLSELKIPKPKYKFSLKSKTANTQIAEIINKLEEILLKEKPKLVVVYGDINSTVAASITANKLNLKICHVESGLRSFDKEMPEEINRIITDSLSNFHFVTEKSGVQNLLREGHDKESIFLVGNTMIDSVKKFLDSKSFSNFKVPFSSGCAHEPFFKKDPFAICTFHRPSNVDTKETLSKIVEITKWLSQDIKLVFPIHPRTEKNLKKYKLLENLKKNNNILLSPPCDYGNFLFLIKHANLVVTDSGGIQEECSYLNTPCLTLRKNTERPITISRGSNVLVDSLEEICKHFDSIKNETFKKSKEIKFWDGKASERIAKIIYEKLS
jgi:UDP-N-acetylglucosamine 2-epimerase (non-hydrolysing)